MTDFDYWKKQYQATWAASSSRESGIAASFEDSFRFALRSTPRIPRSKP